MTIEVISAVVSIILIIVSYVPYLRGMLTKKFRPNPVTWFSWAIVTAAYGIVMLFAGGGLVTWPIALLSVISAVIFVLAIRNGGRADVAKIDVVCFVISILSFVFWLMTHQSNIAVAIFTASQFVAFIPTIRKAWHKPHEDSAYTWGVNSVRWVFMIFAVDQFNFATVANSAFWAVMYGAAAILILARRRVLAVESKTGKK
jgi:hypothetical protein